MSAGILSSNLHIKGADNSVASGATFTFAAGSVISVQAAHATAILDSLGSAARGNVAYRGASAWALLAPGTAGQALLSGGAGADPSWGGIGVGGGGTGNTTYTKGDILVASASTTLSKLAVGTDTYVLTADSGSPTGVSWQVGGGTGTVTHTAGSLTANALVLGAGSGDTKVVAGLATDGTSKLNLGVAGSSVGGVVFANATSGSITLGPVTGALGTVSLLLPAVSDTLAGLVATQTLTNKTLTSPKVGTSILDTGGNELALVTATGSAANQLSLANAATGNNPVLAASGDDTNVGLTLQTKGSGHILVYGPDSDANLTVNSASGGPFIRMQRAGSTKGLWGIAGSADNVITGSATNDMCYRNDASQNIIFSTDAGTSIAFKVTTGGAISTQAPSGASAGAWKLGSLVTGLTLTANLTQALYVDVGGTVYKLITGT